MKKIILHGFIGVFCFTLVTSCDKEVKAPTNRPASAAKTDAVSSPAAQTSNQEQGQNNGTCGDRSGSSSSGTGASSGS